MTPKDARSLLVDSLLTWLVFRATTSTRIAWNWAFVRAAPLRTWTIGVGANFSLLNCFSPSIVSQWSWRQKGRDRTIINGRIYEHNVRLNLTEVKGISQRTGEKQKKFLTVHLECCSCYPSLPSELLSKSIWVDWMNPQFFSKLLRLYWSNDWF